MIYHVARRVNPFILKYRIPDYIKTDMEFQSYCICPYPAEYGVQQTSICISSNIQ